MRDSDPRAVPCWLFLNPGLRINAAGISWSRSLNSGAPCTDLRHAESLRIFSSLLQTHLSRKECYWTISSCLNYGVFLLDVADFCQIVQHIIVTLFFFKSFVLLLLFPVLMMWDDCKGALCFDAQLLLPVDGGKWKAWKETKETENESDLRFKLDALDKMKAKDRNIRFQVESDLKWGIYLGWSVHVWPRDRLMKNVLSRRLLHNTRD